MTIENTKIAKTIGIIAGIIVAAAGIQFARFSIKTNSIENLQGVVLPANYFPFNGTFVKDANGKITKA